MKALLTAGGRATRLRPITYTINKHLIPLANKPMLEHALEKIAQVGIREVGINVNVGETEIQRVIGDGSRWDINISYLEQQGGPKGLAHIVNNARDWIGGDSFLMYLGDNIILGSLQRFVDAFNTRQADCLVALSKVSDPQRFGVPEIKDGKIVRILEKPANPPSDFAVTGIYLCRPCIFDATSSIQPSARGEYELPDAFTWLIERGKTVAYEEITGWWKDTGKPQDLIEGNALLLRESCRGGVRCSGTVTSGAVVQGDVHIGRGSLIDADTVIRGPVSIGEDCRVSGAVIGPGVSIGNQVTIQNTIITNSLVMDGTFITCGGRISDSIFGRQAKVSHAPGDADRQGSSFVIGDNAAVEI